MIIRYSYPKGAWCLPSVCVQDIDHNPYAFGPVLGGHALQAVQATVVKSIPSPQRAVGMLRVYRFL